MLNRPRAEIARMWSEKTRKRSEILVMSIQHVESTIRRLFFTLLQPNPHFGMPESRSARAQTPAGAQTLRFSENTLCTMTRCHCAGGVFIESE